MSLTIYVYLIVLYHSFVRKRGSRIQWSRRRTQISALKWRVEVIQGQSFYAHWKADKLVHVAI